MEAVKASFLCLSKIPRPNSRQDTLNSIILSPQYADYLALVKAARNGAVYGAKVRFPHALV